MKHKTKKSLTLIIPMVFSFLVGLFYRPGIPKCDDSEIVIYDEVICVACGYHVNYDQILFKISPDEKTNQIEIDSLSKK